MIDDKLIIAWLEELSSKKQEREKFIATNELDKDQLEVHNLEEEIRSLELKILNRMQELTKQSLDKIEDSNETEDLIIESNGLKLPIELDYVLKPGETKSQKYVVETKKLLEEVEKENLHVIQIPIRMVPKFALIETNPEFTSTYEMEKREWDTLPPKVYEYGICHNMKNDYEINIIVNGQLPNDLIITSQDREGQFCRREVSVNL